MTAKVGKISRFEKKCQIAKIPNQNVFQDILSNSDFCLYC